MSLRAVLCSFMVMLSLLLAGRHACVSAQFPSTSGGCPSSVPAGPLPSAAELLAVPVMRRALAEMDAAIRQQRDSASIPSVAVSVVYGQRLLWSAGYGQYNASVGSAPGLDTVYRIGSIGKLLTTLLMMVARDRGLLHLDSPVSSLIPDFHWEDPYDPSSRGPTFQQLASHLAGIPSDAGLDVDPFTVTNRVMFALMANLSLTNPTDSLPMYSNLAFASLGNIVAELLNSTYRDALQQLVLDPLGLSSTAVAYDAARYDGRMADGFDYGVRLPDEDSRADWGWFDGEGSHFSTVRDLSSLVSFFLRLHTAAGPAQVISGSSIREMLLPRYVMPDRKAGFATPFELVWSVEDQLLHTKRGDTYGYSSELLFSVPLSLGLVVLVNSIEQAAAVAQLAANILFPAARAAVAALALPFPLPDNWKAFTGQYRCAECEVTASVTGDPVRGLSVAFSFSGSVPPDSIIFGPLQWSGGNATFRILPAPGSEKSCFIVAVEQTAYQWLIFDSSTQPHSFQAPAYFPWSSRFTRVTAAQHSSGSQEAAAARSASSTPVAGAAALRARRSRTAQRQS